MVDRLHDHRASRCPKGVCGTGNNGSSRSQALPARRRAGAVAAAALAFCCVVQNAPDALGQEAVEPSAATRPATAPAPPREPDTQRDAPVPERVMAELRAANAARASLLRAEQDWEMEKSKLELLKATVSDEARRLKAAAAEAKREADKLKDEMAASMARRQRLEQVEAMVDALSERLERALEAFSSRSLPGLVPPDRAAGITDPPARLSAAADRLGEAERQARKTGVELVTGELGDETITVKLLRVGGAAAWWTSLDGKQAGQATLKDGKLTLAAASSPKDAQAVKKAFAVAEGRAAADWALLPMNHVEVKTEAGDQP